MTEEERIKYNERFVWRIDKSEGLSCWSYGVFQTGYPDWGLTENEESYLDGLQHFRRKTWMTPELMATLTSLVDHIRDTKARQKAQRIREGSDG